MGLRVEVEVDDLGAASSVVGAWMVVVDEWLCWVMDFEAEGFEEGGGCGVDGCDSLSESSSQAMFSSGERAAPVQRMG